MPQYNNAPLKKSICTYGHWYLLIGAVLYLGYKILPALWDR